MVGVHVGVADADRIGVMDGAEFFGFFLGADHYCAYVDSACGEFFVEVVQLREWLSEESSTDVPQP